MPMRKLTIDFETRSAAPLKTCGAAAYAQDETTEVICLALKWKEEEPVLWFSPNFRMAIEHLPAGTTVVSDRKVRDMIEEADVIEAHNAQFEFFIWKYVMPRYGFVSDDDETTDYCNVIADKLQCSAAKAAMYGLPRSLEQACEIAGVPQKKDLEGARLMMKLCKPRKALKADILRDHDWRDRTYWYGTPEEFAREAVYCMQDVRAEEALSDALPDLPEAEQKVWRLDLAINNRGVHVDVPACNAVINAIEMHSAKMTKRFRELTGLSSPRQRDATLRELISLGCQMDGLRSADVEKALKSADGAAKEILEIRKSLSKASTAKYKAFINAKCDSDNRIRGSLMYHGAGTGRWTGRLIQPQNFPRGTFPDADACIRLFQTGDVDSVEELYGDPMVAASTCIRGMVTPEKGNDFICADFSSIEGRVLAWVAGEETALNVYREGKDPYKVAASAIYGVPYDEVTKEQRKIGKVAELALGYQGAVGAFSNMANVYGVVVPEEQARVIIDKWRGSRPMTKKLWYELDKACRAAILNHGKEYQYRAVRFRVVKGNKLAIRLPSGRALWYVNPRIGSFTKGGMEDPEAILFDGVESTTRKWGTQDLYGGKLAENITQAIARDLLVNAMFRVEEAGYPVVFHVHDEIISEVPEDFGSVEAFENLMCLNPSWASGVPLKAEGWRGRRYRK